MAMQCNILTYHPPVPCSSSHHHLLSTFPPRHLILSGHNNRAPPISAAATAVTHRPPPPPIIHPEKVEIFKSLEGWAKQQMLPLMKPVEECWQPQDFLPDPSQPSDVFSDQVMELRERTAGLPDEYFVVLVGDMVTEDAIPTYQTMLNTLDGVRDETGTDPSPWATWIRAWTAEENRHGDLLRSYLYLSGRVDMLMVERTVQYLITAGMVTSSSLSLSPFPSPRH